jgi:transcriptional regulator with XRE-family HTH domain
MNIGEALKSHRESRKISLEKISEKTKINTANLMAIEEGNYDSFPSLVYVRGFIRSYAKAIGMNGPEIAELIRQFNMEIKDFNQLQTQEEKKFKQFLSLTKTLDERVENRNIKNYEPESDTGTSDSVASTYANRPSFFLDNWVKSLKLWISTQLWWIIIIILIGGAILLGRVMESQHHGSNMKVASQSIVQQNIPLVAHKLKIVCTQPCWLQISIDHLKPEQYDLISGEIKTFQVTKTAQLIIGNAAGIQIQWNGKVLTHLGGKGQVIHFSLPKFAIKVNSKNSI